jgi:gliding motility-associated transport system ATP-binding protein
MIEVKGLTKYYGSVAAVRDVSFEVGKGEIVGFLGPNGAGKTTTMRILTGFSPASSGSARIDGYDTVAHPLEVKRRVGYLPESVPLYTEMVARKFLTYVAAVKGVPRADRSREVGRVVERCGLGSVAGRVAGNLSKGYRQRLGLAQALIGNPPVLIFDEPTVGLDPKQIVEIRQMIKELAEEHTVLLSTHILPEVAMVCERVIIIHDGRIVAQDTMENLAGASERPVLTVETGGAAGQTTKVIEELPCVTSVVDEGSGFYKVTGEVAAAAASEAVSRALVSAGIPLRSLRPHARTLEDTFLEAISSEEGGVQ